MEDGCNLCFSPAGSFFGFDCGCSSVLGELTCVGHQIRGLKARVMDDVMTDRTVSEILSCHLLGLEIGMDRRCLSNGVLQP
jgi:hypothetical protein